MESRPPRRARQCDQLGRVCREQRKRNAWWGKATEQSLYPGPSSITWTAPHAWAFNLLLFQARLALAIERAHTTPS